MWRKSKKEEDSSRRERGLTQNLFLIETIPSEDDYVKQFVVMGSTGNVYTVTITNEPECTCPDFLRRAKKCKHIYFILLKVMKVDNEDQKYFEDEELEEMFNKIPRITTNLIVNSSLRQLYRQKMGETELEAGKEEHSGTVERKSTNDICPICLENLEDENALDYCKYGCGKSIHKQCFTMWCKKNQRTCVFCRTEWDQKEKEFENEYINLIQAGSLSMTVHIDDLSRERIVTETHVEVVDNSRNNIMVVDQEEEDNNNEENDNIDADLILNSEFEEEEVEEEKEEISKSSRINPYLLFSKDERAKIQNENSNLTPKEILSEVTKRWRNASESVKSKYQKLFEKEKKKSEKKQVKKKKSATGANRKRRQGKSKSVDKRGKGAMAAKKRRRLLDEVEDE